MKFLFVVALLPLIQAVTIIPSDNLIAGITDLQNQIATQSTDSLRTVLSLRQTATSLAFTYKNGYVDVIKTAITDIEVIDTPTRDILAGETPSACITNLVTFLDNIRELSGFAISNCVEDKAGFNAEIATLTDSIAAIDTEINDLIQAILDGLYGRNSYTEPDAILARQLELFNAKSASLAQLLADLEALVEAKSNEVADYDYADEKACFDDIALNVQSAIPVVANQLTVCRTFNTRGSRFAITLNANDFFPGVATRNKH